MSQGNHRDAVKERFWRRRVRQWRASKLSVRVFCEQRGLREGNFYAWRRILAERDAEAKSFVQVQVLPDDKVAEASGLELRLAHDRVVRLDRGFDAPTLQRLLALLSAGFPPHNHGLAPAICICSRIARRVVEWPFPGFVHSLQFLTPEPLLVLGVAAEAAKVLC
jgi:hypothetical protein